MPADINAVRRYVSRPGVSVNLEQQVTETVGVFARAGWADGNVEPWDFTDIDRTASAGVSINGKQWGRPDDTVGVAGVVNGISGVHAAFLNAGGLGILIGDGAAAASRRRGDHRDLLQLRFDRGDRSHASTISSSPTRPTTPIAGRCRFSPGGFTRSSEAQRLRRSALREPVPREHLAHRFDELVLGHGALRLGLFLQMFLAALFQLRQFGADDQVLDGDFALGLLRREPWMTTQGALRLSAYLICAAEIARTAQIKLGADVRRAELWRPCSDSRRGDPWSNTVTTTGPGSGLLSSLPRYSSAAASRDTPMENPVAGTGSPRKRDTSPS